MFEKKKKKFSFSCDVYSYNKIEKIWWMNILTLISILIIKAQYCCVFIITIFSELYYILIFLVNANYKYINII